MLKWLQIIDFLFSQNLNALLFLVLLCNIKQQVLQCHCACPCSDHGECVALQFCYNTAYKQQIKQNFLCLRGCILCHLYCWCAWACHWNIAPLWQRFWESCSSTSTTVGLMSSSWLAPCPASSFCIWLTSRHQRNTWPFDSLHPLPPRCDS